DIRQVGGGNVGALNTIREIGLLAGLAVLIADIAKGLITVLIARWLGLPLIWVFVAGFAAVAGHNWPIFLRFKGGKGAATTLGVLLALVPREFAISFAIMAIVLIPTSNIRLAIVFGLAFLPLIIWQLNGSGMLIAYSLALSLFLVIRNLASFREAMTNIDYKKGLIFDREYHFWQVRKK
ncbi:MAG: glycerol-3-phosphate acyltransferase, partial [Dehalococcoidales bacterium]